MATRITTSTTKKKKKTASTKGKEREEVTPIEGEPSTARPTAIIEEELPVTISDVDNLYADTPPPSTSHPNR
ncbi:hypothetical protein QCA50_018910 [Cerrena zonata]|uniref:Uncharacterized protein n=1 Tax=Cerrena zonata TaxID=2478898 RepID=A0AAW0FLJ7_9APHY